MDPKARAAALVDELRAAGSARNVDGMRRFGIRASNMVGVSVTHLRKVARPLGKDHALARELWATRVHEARILATIVEDPARVTSAQMDRWAKAFDSWDLVDQACLNCFVWTPHAWTKVRAWAARDEEFVKRASLALVACLAWKRKDEPDASFLALLPLVERAAFDERNFVKKAASWALRQAGKRSARLRREALGVARRLAASDAKSARWVGRDVERELTRRT